MEKTQIPEIVNGNSFQMMFQLQRELLESYIVIEGLPKYPVNLHEKAGYKLIKDFSSRIVQELSEAYDSFLQLADLALNDPVTYSTKHDLESLLKDYNEELADAWHFFIELLIYSNIDENAIEAYLSRKAQEEPELYSGFYQPNRPLATLLKLAKAMNAMDGIHFPPKSTGTCFKTLDDEELVKKPNLAGGRIVGLNIVEEHNNFLWLFTFLLNTSIGNLKNKDWIQSPKESNLIAFNEGIFGVLVWFIRYMDFIGQTERGIFSAYYLKNQVNKKRIKDGY